jgi:hypothetical protein
MDLNRGFVCKLTDDVAKFDKECPDFVRDESFVENSSFDEIVVDQDEIGLRLKPQVYEALIAEQDLKKGILFGFLSGIVGAVTWGAITVAINYQIGYMAIGLGLMVGFTVRFFGNGIEGVFGFWGAGISLFSCALGNFFSIVGFIANYQNLGYVETLTLLDYSLLPEIMAETFKPMDILFYGLALFAGYKYSFRKITEEDIKILNK